jgi:hypothetical protein
VYPASRAGLRRIHQHIDAGHVATFETERPHGIRNAAKVAAVHRHSDIARHPRGQWALFGNVQKNSHSTDYTVLDTGGSQSGCDSSQYFEKLFHVLVVCSCGDHGPMVPTAPAQPRQTAAIALAKRR